MTYPASAATPEKNQRDLLTLVTGALASLVLIGTSLAALNKNVIGFRAWPGTSNEPTPSAILPAAKPAVSSTRATFGFNGPDGTSSLAIVGLPGAGLPGFRPPVAPTAGGPGLGTRTTIGEAPAGPPAPVVPDTPTPTPTPTPAPVTPVASAPVTVGPVPTSITAPTKTDDKSDRKAEKARRKAEKARDTTGTAAAPQATAAAAPVAPTVETTRESTASAPVATKGNGNAGPQRRHEERKGKKASRRAAPAAAPAPPAAVAAPAPAPTPAGAPSAGPQASGDGPGNAGRSDKGPKGGKGGKGHGPF